MSGSQIDGEDPPGGRTSEGKQRRVAFALVLVLTLLIAVMVCLGRSFQPTLPVPLPAPTGKPKKKVILLGFDGADPKLCKRWMSEIDSATNRPALENLARISERGTFTTLRTTYPAQTPVAWASAACSANPGKTSIADFVGRNPEDMSLYLTLAAVERKPLGLPLWQRWLVAGLVAVLSLPLFVMLARLKTRYAPPLSRSGARVRGALSGLVALGIFFLVGYALSHWVPLSVPTARNLRKGTPLWKVVGDAGARSVFLKFPLTFPAETASGMRMLSGFGVPDLTGSPYTWTCFDPKAKEEKKTETLGTVKPWVDSGGRWSGTIMGPADPFANRGANQEATRKPIPVAYTGGTLRIGDAAPQSLKLNAWTDPFRLSIRFSPLLRLRATVRAVQLTESDPPRIVIGPPQFDPENLPPNVPISTPVDYAGRLTSLLGTFPTVGWTIATHPAKDGYLADEPFLQDLHYAFARHEDLFRHELARDDWDVLSAVFMATDRAGHILWKHMSPTHPLHDPKTAPAGKAALRRVYQRMDAIVGMALQRAGEIDAEVLVISDHGFAAFDYQVHLNSALRDAGLLKLRAESLPASATQVRTGENFSRIDFSATDAYAVGLGGIYFNMQGRERDGKVQEDERDLLAMTVTGVLMKIKDPKTGMRVVERVVRNEDVYRGPYSDRLPDLLVCFKPGYRVSWATTVGGAPERIIEPNRSAWSGDHCSVDPLAVPGVLYSTRPVASGREDSSLVDVAPSVMWLLGSPVPASAGWEGRSIFGDRQLTRH